MFTNYLIIILNRGNGNIFNCKVEIPEIFDSSNYEERDINKKYELIGVVSGINGTFIAFCKHSIDNKWRCYNDNIVTECQNDFLNKGIPYILFYKRVEKNNINNNQQQNTMINMQGFNPNMNFNNNINNNTFQGNFNPNNFGQNMNMNNNNFQNNNTNMFNLGNMNNN